MSTIDTQPSRDVVYDQFRMTTAPPDWMCNAPHILRDEQDVPFGDERIECWGTNLLQYEVHRTSTDTWERTYKAACQRHDHRTIVTTQLGKPGYYPDAVFVDEGSEDHRRAPMLMSKPAPVVDGESSVAVELVGLTDLQRRILAYCIGGDGSTGTRYQAFTWLAEAETFFPGRQDRFVTEDLERLVEENPMGACQEGIQRFREAFGLSAPMQNWSATLTNNGATCATIAFQLATTSEEEARAHVDNHLRLSYIDRALSGALDEFDGDGFTYSGEFDVLLEDVEHIGPAE